MSTIATAMNIDAVMADQSPYQQNTVNKPGTSCLGCRRRKLKCDRATDGCHNCRKSELPCVYPAPETGLKRKRGPYKKDKPPKERHLEDLVKYLEPKNPGSSLSPGGVDTESPGGQTTSSGHSRSPLAQNGPANLSRHPGQTANSEDLVKDALFALSRSGLADHQTRYDDAAFSRSASNGGQNGVRYSNPNKHPSPREIFEYWNIFIARVDPMVKVIHCPAFSKRLLAVVDDFNNISTSLEAMIFSVCYSALSACTAREVRARFGEARDVLLSRYSHQIETLITKVQGTPDLEGLQALVLYLVCNRGDDRSPGFTALFNLAVRLAQSIGLGDDPDGSKVLPLEIELRRRLWYHLCGLESRTAEESGSRNTAYLKGRNVQLPKNLNDCDLDQKMTTSPESREGVTDMTLPILRFEIHKLVFGLWNIRKEQYSSQVKQEGSHAWGVREQQTDFFENSRARLENLYMQHMDTTRPYDWLCIMFIQGMMIKARLLIDFPNGTVPTREMPKDERMELLKSSVEIIKCTYGLGVDDRISDWNWYFRGYVQWHALAIVVAELGWSQDNDFSSTAWQVLDPILNDWDRAYQRKKDDKEWAHVNSMVQRARRAREFRRAQSQRESQTTFKKPRMEDNSLPAIQRNTQQHQNTLPPMNQQAQHMHQAMPTHQYSKQPHGNNTIPSPSAAAGAPMPPTSLSSGVATPGSYGSLHMQGGDSNTPLEYGNGNEWLVDPNMGFESLDFNAWQNVWNDDSWALAQSLSWDSSVLQNQMPQSGAYWNPPGYP